MYLHSTSTVTDLLSSPWESSKYVFWAMQTYVPDCDRSIVDKTRLVPDWLKPTPSLIHCVKVSAGLPAMTLQGMTSVVPSTALSVSNGCIEGGSAKYKRSAYVILVHKRVKYICIEGPFIFYRTSNVSQHTISNVVITLKQRTRQTSKTIYRTIIHDHTSHRQYHFLTLCIAI